MNKEGLRLRWKIFKLHLSRWKLTTEMRWIETKIWVYQTIDDFLTSEVEKVEREMAEEER